MTLAVYCNIYKNTSCATDTSGLPSVLLRGGVSRGVCSRKVLREFESFAPVRAFVFPRPNAKPPTVRGKLRTAQRNNETGNKY